MVLFEGLGASRAEGLEPKYCSIHTSLVFLYFSDRASSYNSGRWPTWNTISSIICLSESSTCFQQLCAHPQEDKCINTTSRIITLNAIDHSTVFRVITPEVVLIHLSSWGWAQSCWKHVEESNKYIIEETVRQVGHLQESLVSVFYKMMHQRESKHVAHDDDDNKNICKLTVSALCWTCISNCLLHIKQGKYEDLATFWHHGVEPTVLIQHVRGSSRPFQSNSGRVRSAQTATYLSVICCPFKTTSSLDAAHPTEHSIVFRHCPPNETQYCPSPARSLLALDNTLQCAVGNTGNSISWLPCRNQTGYCSDDFKDLTVRHIPSYRLSWRISLVFLLSPST
jgi:hypothetical protein